MLNGLFWQVKMSLGDAVQTTWVHASDKCPGCGTTIKKIKYKGQDVVSLNTFIYREKRVLIGYFLCGKCAKFVLGASQKDPDTKTSTHDRIEETLKAAYIKKSGH